jgi:ADP-ribose pyrophosphatase YjhB (NUDIX family)
VGLPGGWLGGDEGLERAASRTLAETTTLTPSYLEQLYAFGDPALARSRRVDRVLGARARGRLARIRAAQRRLVRCDRAPALAFDHNQIVDYALWRLRNKVGYSRIAHGLLPDLFTLADLREVYEAILERRLDPANFRRQVENSATLIPTDASAPAATGRRVSTATTTTSSSPTAGPSRLTRRPKGTS